MGTSVFLTGTYQLGYAISPGVTNVYLSTSAYVGGVGLTAGGDPCSINNDGKVGGDGVSLGGVGTIVNGGPAYRDATIEGTGSGVWISGDGYVANFGSILNAGPGRTDEGAVQLVGGGELVNGGSSDTSALIEGSQGVVVLNASGGVDNYGSILATADFGAAINFYLGGDLVNGSLSDTSALISGLSGVQTGDAYAKIANYGTIVSDRADNGLYFSTGGLLTNGARSDTVALVRGGDGVEFSKAPGTVINFGAIVGVGGAQPGYGIVMLAGGGVTNGGASDTGALVEGYENGVVIANGAGAVTNFATILGDGGDGVFLGDGGQVTNSGRATADALIGGTSRGIYVTGGIGAVTNFGTVTATAAGGLGVYMVEGGTMTNGSSTDTRALVEGYQTGIAIQGNVGTVVNFASIIGDADGGVTLAGGQMINGGGANRTALVEGVEIGVLLNGVGTLNNFGTVMATGGSGACGAVLGAGGAVTNGSATNNTALIEGYNGVVAVETGTIVNFGTIAAVGDTGGFGVSLRSGDALTNGGAGHASALIVGYTGVATYGAATVTNFGVIDGLGGTAVNFMATGCDLVVEAGATFIGQVLGDGGTLDLASGVGTITSLLVGGEITESGSTTTFANFGTAEVGSGADFTLAGTGGTIATGQGLIVAGTLAGTGTLALTGGTATFDTGADLTIAKVAESGTAVANFAGTTITIADVWTQTAGTVSAATGDRVNFTGTGDTFSGTLSGAGTVGFTGGTDTLSGATLSATSVTIDGAAVTLLGTIDLTKTLSVTSNDLTIATAGATLSGKGIVSLSDSAANIIKGASASALLTNFDDKIEGAGDLGDGEMALTNDAGGTIEAYLGVALTINLGTNTLINAGLIENAGTGGLTIDGATNNTGTLEAVKGTLTVDGAVSGAGTVKIAGGAAAFASTFTQNVAFTSAGGILKLADATTYTGTITGFAKTSITSLDLTDIAFTGATVSYSGTATSGVLTVKSGANTAKINLTGDYTTSTFTLGKDASGGTIVTDPPAVATKPPVTTLPLVTAMAGFGMGNGAATEGACFARPDQPMILLAHGQFQTA